MGSLGYMQRSTNYKKPHKNPYRGRCAMLWKCNGNRPSLLHAIQYYYIPTVLPKLRINKNTRSAFVSRQASKIANHIPFTMQEEGMGECYSEVDTVVDFCVKIFFIISIWLKFQFFVLESFGSILWLWWLPNVSELNNKIIDLSRKTNRTWWQVICCYIVLIFHSRRRRVWRQRSRDFLRSLVDGRSECGPAETEDQLRLPQDCEAGDYAQQRVRIGNGARSTTQVEYFLK